MDDKVNQRSDLAGVMVLPKPRKRKPRKVGPPKGHLNGATHGGYAWLKRREVPAERAHVMRAMFRYERELIEDQGGKGSVTAAKRMLIDQAVAAGGCWRLMWEEALMGGFIKPGEDESVEIAPMVSKCLATFQNTERLALQAIGTGRVARDVIDIGKEIAGA